MNSTTNMAHRAKRAGRKTTLSMESLECRQLLAADAFALDEPVSTGSVHGVKWQDDNGNGLRDKGEPGLAGVVVYGDLNRNEMLDRGEPNTRTIQDDPNTRADEAGLYWLEGLPPGDHQIREIVPEGYRQTFPHSVSSVLSSNTGAIRKGVALDFDVTDVDVFADGTTQLELTVVWPDSCGSIKSEMTSHEVIGNSIVVNVHGEQVGRNCAEVISPESQTIRIDRLEPGRYDVSGTLFESSLRREVPTLEVDARIDLRKQSHHDVAVSANQQTTGINFGNQPLPSGSIHGTKWLDSNGDGSRQRNEPGLPGVTIYLDVNRDGDLDVDEPRTRTMRDDPNTAADESGLYWLTDVEPGTHAVREVVPDGFVQTFPREIVIDPLPDGDAPDQSPPHVVAIQPGLSVEGIDFGNQRILPGAIHGTKWLDSNGDGQRDHDEPGIGGVEIFTDVNRNGVLDVGEPSTRTMHDDPDTDFDEAGLYWLDGLRTGLHNVREVVPDGFVQTFPEVIADAQVDQGMDNGFATTGPESLALLLGTGEVERTNVSVTVHPLCIRPYTIDVISSDPAIQIQNNTGILVNGCGGDTSEFDIQIEGDGSTRQFDLLFVDSEFGDTLATMPVTINSGGHRILVESGAAVEGVDFGNQRIEPGTAHGTKWEDRDGDGERDSDEPGLPGVVIYSDLNNNGRLDRGEPLTRTMQDDPVTATDEAGLYWLTGLEPGAHILREIVPDGFQQTFPATASSDTDPPANDNDFTSISPASVHAHLGAEALDLTAEIVIHPLCFRPYEIDVVATDPMIEITNTSGVLVNGCGGDVSSFDVTIESDGLPRQFELQFVDAEFGGTLGSIPVTINSGSHRVDIGIGTVVDGVDFGNQRIVDTGSIHGAKWLDRNGDGRRDSDEPGIPGVVIYSDVNGNHRLDRAEPRTETMQDDPHTDFDEAGMYWLTDLEPGEHVVREVVPDGFRQTFPATAPAAGATPTNDAFVSVSPETLNLYLENGEVESTDVSVTVHPFCFRPYEVDVVSSNPNVQIENNTGVLVNGCGGDTSTFSIDIASDGSAQAFELQFVDVEFGGTIASIPMTINDGGHVVVVEAGVTVEGVDFGNQQLVPGDSNHDGLFNSADLVAVFIHNEYEDGIDGNSTFEEGDWNGDGDFDSADFVYVFSVGNYEKPAAAVPIAIDFVNDPTDNDRTIHRRAKWFELVDGAFTDEVVL